MKSFKVHSWTWTSIRDMHKEDVWGKNFNFSSWGEVALEAGLRLSQVFSTPHGNGSDYVKVLPSKEGNYLKITGTDGKRYPTTFYYEEVEA